MNQSVLRGLLKGLALRVYEDAPEEVPVDYAGQQVGEEGFQMHYGDQALRESPWLEKAIVAKATTGRWPGGMNGRRRFWLGKRLEWVLAHCPDGEGLGWLHAHFVKGWEAGGWREAVQELEAEENEQDQRDSDRW